MNNINNHFSNSNRANNQSNTINILGEQNNHQIGQNLARNS
jgi:hypothetical protein